LYVASITESHASIQKTEVFLNFFKVYAQTW